jgi:hypothetical protein
VGTDDEAVAAQAVKELALKHSKFTKQYYWMPCSWLRTDGPQYCLSDCVVGMTGVIDYVSDGKRVIALENGHELMASITGSGCMATTVVGCFTAG